ncbi:hypothetical protein DV515_00005214 [Chloebia gouldiae]|uniref:Uncharacterized protein n=1 Tax=Chloebia gouldiae TaxID=44316 RepID=A0A3L8SNR9_CHLGU|nr:hypothetical protein DV515_00005214 [Chloebia gouldiae]
MEQHNNCALFINSHGICQHMEAPPFLIVYMLAITSYQVPCSIDDRVTDHAASTYEREPKCAPTAGPRGSGCLKGLLFLMPALADPLARQVHFHLGNTAAWSFNPACTPAFRLK